MKNISIKLKLLLLSIISLLTLSAILVTVSINKVEETLIDIEYTKLTSARDSKIKQLSNIFQLYSKQISLLTDTTYAKQLTLNMQAIHESMGVDQHGKFPINASEVQKELPKWDKFYKVYTDTYPFDDVFVVSAQHGHVIYSYGKKKDFGTNLTYGEYRTSALAKLWAKVKKYQRVVFIDMSIYAPRDGEPSIFIGAPVYIKGVLKSILIYKIDNKKIKEIMHFRSGYANSHEDYLVGSDLLMRSDSFLSQQTHSLSRSLSNPNSGKVDTIASNEALLGKSGTQIISDYRGRKVLSSYTPFKIDEELTWAMISEMDYDEVAKNPRELRNTLILLTLITFAVVLLILYFVIQKYIISSLNKFQEGLLDFFNYLNRDTNDIKLLEELNNDEIGTMSKAVNKGIKKIKKNIQKSDDEAWIKDGVTQLNQILINVSSVDDVTKESMNFICKYLNAGVGVMYRYRHSSNTLRQEASYAHIIRDELSNEFHLGEGVIGQVALQKEPILLTKIKKETNLITTGTLTQSAYNTYTFPLVYNDELFGVIEIGSFETITPEQMNFLEIINRIVCIALSSALQNKRVQTLLDTSKKANQELEINQAKLEEANTYMEEQQQQLEEANANMEEQQQQLEEANANMEEQQQQLKISEQNLKLQNQQLEDTKQDIQLKADELAQSSRYKSEFLANMSHELRTPLNSIILLSSLLQRNSKATLNVDDIKKARTIFDSGNELLRLINDILDLSKVESGKMHVIIDKFKSSTLLHQMNDSFKFTAIDKGLTFEIIDEYNNFIYSDKDRIAQIIRNLISNALKFTKEGSITLKILPSQEKDKDFRISVIDSGIGIPLEKQDLIFKAFTQANGGTSREFGGTGLGLSISKELTKLLQGNISLTSKENEGSTFSLDLPNLDIDDLSRINEHSEHKKEVPLQKARPELTSHKTVNDDRKIITSTDETYLIIDDDETFANVVYEEIKNNQQFGLIALDATSGLALVKRYNIKGILLDLTLPDMSGVDVLKELKSNANTRHIPVHIISSKDKNSETLELGAIGYLQKPAREDDISEVLNSLDNFSGKKIKDLLIVEDNKVHREALIEIIGEGVNITGVKNAKEAIREVKKEKYDTVVVDLGLIDSNGYEVCEFIKNNHPNLPIIIYTGKELDENEKIKLQEYSNSIIIKTANSNERILNEINIFLHRDEIKEDNQQELFEEIDLENLNILIVDDDIKNIFVLDAALKEFNASTHTAFNGQEALDLLAQNKNIDLVLMDIMMPIMNGYEAIEKIREDASLQELPIIAVTAKAMKEDREKCIRLGANDYLAKPINLNVLGKMIKAWSTKKS